ncbi:hypothetical protein ABVK25_006241 [Lepraria finkii]|uniref:Peptide hydrolase n=1 Tax=Lepraria finkii TaxID=1340010 RepID=A0ABR4BCF9_9LECA
MKTSFRNPFSFSETPVTVITSIVYLALIVPLLVVHHVVPEAPGQIAGTNVDLTEAWLDLQTLSNGFHPYNSHRNDVVRDWLLRRIDALCGDNPVVVFSDMVSNVSFSEAGRGGGPGISVYFEGTNIIVYIRGSEDDPEEWYLKGKNPQGKGGVLVNAHYDSVPVGFGATDDGVGVVTVLQLIKYFSSSGRQPKRGVVALLNNGEEDWLNGAWAFSKHPMSRFPHTFLNLEGAGAGGRATLFRSTDTEVTRSYQNSKYPFGAVVSADAFKRGLIRSGTDYSVFTEVMGMRGLDVAFMEPRARYHTTQDDTRHTSRASLHHMLSAALSTMQGLTSDMSSAFDGKDAEKGKVPSGKGSDGVWFDLFGSAFAVFRLNTLFALSVTLLVVGPLTLIVTGVVLYKVDKLYLFSSSKQHHHAEGDDSVAIQGWRGLFRWPITFVLATAAVIGLAFVTATANPYIICSSPTGTELKNSGQLPDHVLLRLHFLSDLDVFFFELFGLPRKSAYADEIEAPKINPIARSRPESISSARLMASAEEEQPPGESPDNVGEDEEDPTESTSLLGEGRRTTFKRYTSPHRPGPTDDIVPESKTNRLIYGSEQPWSHSLPSTLWLLEFFLLAPFPLILFGQVALLFTTATYQTLADGNDPLYIYLFMAVLTVVMFAPLAPFLHRYTYHIPMFLLLVLVGTTIYNLTAFPFSESNRLKLYFLQRVDLDTGINNVSLTGIPFLHEVISSLPSAAGQSPFCFPSSLRRDLTDCNWNGLPPRVVPNVYPDIPPEFGFVDWLTLNANRDPDGKTEAHFYVSGKNTRACKLVFNRPIVDFSVEGAADEGRDRRFQKTSEYGSKELRLWSRTWERGWNITVRWEAGGDNEGNGLDGRVVCLWSDANDIVTIPALEEAMRFAPSWVAVVNNQNGLVEGSKTFLV